MEIPMFIRRCLTYGIQIYPYQLSTILLMSKKYNVPDDKMELFDKIKTQGYIDALYLSAQESSNEWSRGHLILKELGFEEITRKDGHRSFVTLKYKEL